MTNELSPAAGNLTNAISVAGTRTYSFDEAERLTGLQAPVASFVFAFNTNSGLMSAMTNTTTGVSAQYGFDVCDQLTNIVWRNSTGAVLRSFSYALNSAGAITNIQLESGTNISYSLDQLDRLIGEKRGTECDISLGYDCVGNRTNMTVAGTNIQYTCAAGGNRLTSWGTNGENTATYDSAGSVTNLVEVGKPTLKLTWDGLYQLTSTTTNGVAAESYEHDAFGRRTKITAGTNVTCMIYAGPHVIADAGTGGALIRSYVWNSGIDNMLALTVHTGATAVTYYPLTDHQGTIHAFVNASGQVVESYKFDAWGRVLGVYGSTGQTLTASTIGNRYLFQGREYSWRTGLYYFRARWYMPQVGRWCSADPIGISGGMNLWEFCANNPVNVVDPSGEAWTDVDIYGAMEDMATAGAGKKGFGGTVQEGFYSGMTALLDTIGGQGVNQTAGLSGNAAGSGNTEAAVGWAGVTVVQMGINAVGYGGAKGAFAGFGKGAKHFTTWKSFFQYERGSGILPSSVFRRLSHLDPVSRGVLLKRLGAGKRLGLSLQGLSEPLSVLKAIWKGPTTGGVLATSLGNVLFHYGSPYLSDGACP